VPGRQFLYLMTSIFGLLALICFQEVSVADLQAESGESKVIIVESPSDSAALALLKLIEETEVESIAQVEAINAGRFQPFLVGKEAQNYAQ